MLGVWIVDVVRCSFLSLADHMPEGPKRMKHVRFFYFLHSPNRHAWLCVWEYKMDILTCGCTDIWITAMPIHETWSIWITDQLQSVYHLSYLSIVLSITFFFFFFTKGTFSETFTHYLVSHYFISWQWKTNDSTLY